MKRCSKCRIEKPISGFFRDSTQKEGYCLQCKECQKEHYKENKEKILKYHKEYRKLNKDKINEYQKEYNRKNKEEITKRAKKYRVAHKEKLLVYFKEYRETHKDEIVEYRGKNKEKLLLYGREHRRDHKDKIYKQYKGYSKTPKGKITIARRDHKRRALYKNECSDMTPTRWTNILNSQSNKCNICHKKFTVKRPATQDHIVPISKGGSLQSENIQALCSSCNSSKHAKLDISYIQTWVHNGNK